VRLLARRRRLSVVKCLYLESRKEREQEQFTVAVERFAESQFARQHGAEYLSTTKRLFSRKTGNHPIPTQIVLTTSINIIKNSSQQNRQEAVKGQTKQTVAGPHHSGQGDKHRSVYSHGCGQGDQWKEMGDPGTV